LFAALNAFLDGPRAGRDELRSAARALREGGRFGYRFYYPPMQVGKYEVLWHLPMVAFVDHHTGKPRLLDDAPLPEPIPYRYTASRAFEVAYWKTSTTKRRAGSWHALPRPALTTITPRRRRSCWQPPCF